VSIFSADGVGGVLASALDGISARQNVIADNIANVDTPGFRASTIDFETSLRAAGSAVPFGFVTSEGSPDMRARASAGGALFLIAKPFTPEAFDEALAPVLRG
jgi:two-component system chemotaxis response regulator CheY